MGDINPTGWTPDFSFESDVYSVNLWDAMMKVMNCSSIANCVATTGRSRQQVLTAFGTGIGNTAAHELGHQAPFYFTAHFQGCSDCYDSRSAVFLGHFSGPLHWSDWAKPKMKPLLASK